MVQWYSPFKRQGQLELLRTSPLLVLCGSLGFNSAHQTWQPTSLPTEHFDQPESAI